MTRATTPAEAMTAEAQAAADPAAGADPAALAAGAAVRLRLFRRASVLPAAAVQGAEPEEVVAAAVPEGAAADVAAVEADHDES